METAYILLTNKDDHAVAVEALGIIAHRREMTTSLLNKSTVYGNIIAIHENRHQYHKCVSLPSDTWSSLQDLVVAMETETSRMSTKEHNYSTVSDTIHRLADRLPCSGVPVHLLWVHPRVSAKRKSFLPTLGAILRLVHWHNAKVSIVHQGEITEDVQSLVSVCQGRVVSDVQCLSLSHKIWMGKISVTSKIEGHGIVFPGFSMSFEDEHLLYSQIIASRNHKSEFKDKKLSFGRMLEVLDEIDIRTIPLYMLSPVSVKLHLESEHPQSEDFVQYVNGLDKLCLVARIAVYQKDSVPLCVDTKFSTISWKESIMADISNVQEIDEEILPLAKFVHLVIMREMIPDDPTSLKAIVMTRPEDINPELFSITRNHSLSCRKKHSKFDMNKFVTSLPQLDDVSLQDLHQSLISIQMAGLKDWIDKLKKKKLSTVLTKKQLYKFLTDIQVEFLATVLPDCPSVKSSDKTEQTDVRHFQVLDLNIEPADWPERLALQYLENQKRALRRFQSSDSFALSSPLPPEEAVGSVDATDFLRYFHPDGNAAIDKRPPIRQQSRSRLKRSSSQNDTSLKWPECKDIQYHDIYYNRDRKDEKHAKHFSKMRDKLQRQETHGLCSSVLKPVCKTSNHPAKRTSHLFSPSRKSSRKTKSTGNKELNLSGSSKQDSTFQTVRKTPDSSCTLRRSPRKHSSCTLRRSPRKKPSSNFDSNKHAAIITRPNKRKRSPDGAQEQSDVSIHEIEWKTAHDDKSKLDKKTAHDDKSKLDKKTAHDDKSKLDKKTAHDDKSKLDKQSRSQRHKKKLEQIVRDVLLKSGLKKDDSIYKSCETKLFQVTKFFVKTLPNSRNLSEEMRHIAEGQVTQVVDLEKRHVKMKSTKKAKLKR